MGNTPPSIYMTQHHMQEILSHSQSHPSQSLPRDKTPMSPKQPTLMPPFKRQRIDITPSHITYIENEPISAPIPISPHTHVTHLSGRAASEPLPHGTRSRSSSPRSSSPLPRDPHNTQIQIYALMKADPSMFGYAMIHSPRASPQPTYIPSPTPSIPISTSAISSSLSTSTTSSYTTMNTSTSPPTSTSTSTPTPICMDPSTEMSQRWDAWQQSLQPSEDEDESEDEETPTSPFILSTSSPSYASSSSPSYASSSSSSPSPTSFSSPSFTSTSHRRPIRTRPLTLRHQLHLDQINRKRKLQSDTTSWGWEPISPACSETSSCSSPSISISTSSPTPALSVLTWSTDSPSSSSSLSSDLS